ncbi:AMP-binding protein [Sorangium sp. So ce1151]|uniref:AMP-binding protein n=1 Tax=Sorangium sp. So ce1151 TaxID=3133332 RepID=UPI003F5DA6E2
MNALQPGAPAESMRSFVELMSERAASHPERVALRFLGDGEAVSDTFTYRELHERACAFAAYLQSMATKGERALIACPSGPDYVIGFLACLYAGLIAVPAYPPDPGQPHHVKRLLSIVRDARPRLVLTCSELLGPFEAVKQGFPELAQVEIVAVGGRDAAEHALWRMPEIGAGDIAFLQYTSGSTAAPKGVMVGHDNLIANEVVIRHAFSMTDDDVVVSWLPLFHDMGLIGGLLQPLFSGQSAVLMGPQHFIERPMRWLQAISRFGGTVSGAPDFAYRLCVERARAALPEGLDLSGWRLAFCGAEPLRAATLRAFSERFGAAGFDASALYPCFGLAEATLFVTGGRRGDGAVARGFDAKRLAESAASPAEAGQVLVGCGDAQPLHEVVVVDPETGAPAAPGRVGEIQVSGPSVTHGYWEKPEATEATFVAREGRVFLRTGDLGFKHEGELFITGRLKDLILVRGHNLYPQDVERTIEEQVEVVRKGRVAAFAVELGGAEGIGVAAEVSRRVQKLIEPEDVCRFISETVAEAHGEPASVVVLVQPGALPITTSGKLQRAACRKGWQRGALDAFAVYEQGRMTVAAAAVRSVEEQVQ